MIIAGSAHASHEIKLDALAVYQSENVDATTLAEQAARAGVQTVCILAQLR